MDLTTAIATAAQAVAIVKDLRSIENSFSEAEIKAKMAELYSNLADVRMALADAQEDMRKKDAEIVELKRKLQRNEDLVEAGGYPYAKNAEGKPTGSPFCPACLAADGTQIRPANLLADHWQCPRCKALYSGLRIYA